MAAAENFDVLVLGAGVLGLSIALELAARGASVLALDPRTALTQASSAAAGMLAVDDPHNPPALHELSAFSRSLYPGYLHRLEVLSQRSVPVQTRRTRQYFDDGAVQELDEWSIDPRMLAPALRSAARAAGVVLHEDTPLHALHIAPSGPDARFEAHINTHTNARFEARFEARCDHGRAISAGKLIVATGAWGLPPELTQPPALHTSPSVTPSKGQMLRVTLPPSLAGLDTVYRRGAIYIVPRTSGPRAGTALLGATVEDAGFDTTVHAADLTWLRAQCAELLPAFADESAAPALESWAGLRPSTPDGLPLLGELTPGDPLCALGAGRNGILLTPAIAHLLADLAQQRQPALDLTAFSPSRGPHAGAASRPSP